MSIEIENGVHKNITEIRCEEYGGTKIIDPNDEIDIKHEACVGCEEKTKDACDRVLRQGPKGSKITILDIKSLSTNNHIAGTTSSHGNNDHGGKLPRHWRANRRDDDIDQLPGEDLPTPPMDLLRNSKKK